jgi:Protein of unknown function (DUF1236)
MAGCFWSIHRPAWCWRRSIAEDLRRHRILFVCEPLMFAERYLNVAPQTVGGRIPKQYWQSLVVSPVQRLGNRLMSGSVRVPMFQTAAFVLALTFAVAGAGAQTAATDSAAGPALDLSAAQRQTIYQSVTTTQKNSPAPTGFRVAVGAIVPDGIELQPMPATIASLIPATAKYRVAMVEKQVVLVAPDSRRVVAVVVAQ